jgi:5-methylcytosine-specific restriction endonuclease McrBC GTP-binding regulatory subunit McrB
MHDSVLFTPQEIPQPQQTRQIPYRTYLATDHVQVHQAQTVLHDHSLKDWIGSENVNLPSLRLGNLAQPQNDAASPAEAGVAGDMKEPDRFHFLMSEHKQRT